MSYASGQNGTAGPVRPAWPRRPSGPPANPARERAITRLAVLKAAAAFAASRPDATSADVLKVAASWEAWVNR